MNFTIILADDHAVIRDGLIPFLERLTPDTRVVEAASLAEAMQTAQTCPSLGMIILDLYMPGMDGVNGLVSMRDRFPNVPTVILSGSMEPLDAMRAMDHGAAGYLPKTMRGTAILGALRLILEGERYIPPFLLQRTALAIEPDGADQRLVQLSPREREILAYVVDGAPNKVIARYLDLQEVTVKAHLRNIFRKLSAHNRTEAARIALDAGLTGRKNGKAPQLTWSSIKADC